MSDSFEGEPMLANASTLRQTGEFARWNKECDGDSPGR
jgi:hypothetical protein